MKKAFAFIVTGTLLAAGCSSSKPAPTSEALNVESPALSQTPMPISYSSSSYNSGYSSKGPSMDSGALPASLGTSYTIQHGDTLWKIASQHYGDGHKWKQIADANPGLDPAKLQVGKSIMIP